MKYLWIALFVFVCAFSTRAAAAPNRAAGDAAWSEIVKSSKTSQNSAQLADDLKAFYEQFPDHPKASTAWIKEQSLRQTLGGPTAPKLVESPAAAAPVDNSLNGQIQQATARVKKAQQHSVEAGLGEMERSGHKLSDEFPNSPVGWQMLGDAAQGFGGEKARQLYAYIAAKAPAPKLKEAASARLKAMNTTPPAKAAVKTDSIKLAFTAADGRVVDLAQMTGKVVLIDFWATWCPPCRASIPNVKKTYDELHEKGFEIIGVSFDNDVQAMKRFVGMNALPWPQFCDGGGWQNAVNKDFGINAIPTMYLIDKKGVLRYKDADTDLAGKVRSLLAEN